MDKDVHFRFEKWICYLFFTEIIQEAKLSLG